MLECGAGSIIDWVASQRAHHDSRSVLRKEMRDRWPKMPSALRQWSLTGWGQTHAAPSPDSLSSLRALFGSDFLQHSALRADSQLTRADSEPHFMDPGPSAILDWHCCLQMPGLHHLAGTEQGPIGMRPSRHRPLPRQRCSTGIQSSAGWLLRWLLGWLLRW
jgi:hypothetical protein